MQESHLPTSRAEQIKLRLLFAALYFSEGAPIGFIWWALPAHLRGEGVGLAEITAIVSLAVIPWTIKFAWAPLVDRLQTRWWTLGHWIVTAQAMMVLTLLPLLWLDWSAQLSLLRLCLLSHSFMAATQDVAVDGLCMATSRPAERGRLNGWMQAGMLMGRALFGGLGLVAAARWGTAPLVLLLLAATGVSALLVVGLRGTWLKRLNELRGKGAGDGPRVQEPRPWREAERPIYVRLLPALLFAVLAGAAFEGLGALQGPLLVDQGFGQELIGWWLALPNVACMALGSLLGGYLADRFGARRTVAAALVGFALAVLLVGRYLGGADLAEPAAAALLLGLNALAVGAFTAASYAMFMNLVARSAYAATLFSLFMSGTNACEAWSGYLAGIMAEAVGYQGALTLLAKVSLLSLPLLLLIRLSRKAAD